MGMDRCLDLLEYYIEHPPSHLILATAYLKDTPSSRKSWKPPTEDEAVGQMRQLSGELNAGTQRFPPHLRELAQWAKETSAKVPKS
jgi:hypothetical protein